MVSDGERRVLIRSERPQPNEIRILVRDTGIGIPREQMPQVFEAFYTTKPSGLGMGLSISRTIVETHGGRLSVDASGGRGATFEFTLPLESPT